MFSSQGASIFDDEAASWAHYGGIISGIDSNTGRVRLWAPSYSMFGRGAIINLGQGSGGLYDSRKVFIAEKNVQKTHTALVRVAVLVASSSVCFTVCTSWPGTGSRVGRFRQSA